MKMHGLKTISRMAILTSILAVFASASLAQTGSSADWSAALDSNTFLKFDTIKKNAPQSILLVGENHASVKTQQQLADLLEKLYKEQKVDAILVEGSFGPIEAGLLRRRLNLMKVGDTGQFWKGQLDWGHIAGYEYIALTRPNVVAYGIEDMDAKDAYVIEAARRQTVDGFQKLIEKHKRALALALKASAGFNADALQSSGTNENLANYQSKIDEFTALINSSGNKYAEWLETDERLNALYRKMAPARNYLAARKGVRRTDALLIAAFKTAGYARVEDALADTNRIKEADTWLQANQSDLENVAKNIVSLEEQLEDQFFIVANSLRAAGGNTPIPALQSFMRDERERARLLQEKENPEAPYLVNRDHHMIENVHNYLAANPQIRRAVMIVGYAHVDDLSKLFRQENFNVVAGRISASTEETESWEYRAWNLRSKPAERIFSSGSRKEQSRLQDPAFRQEMPAQISVLRTLGKGIVSGNSSIHEIRTGTSTRTATKVAVTNLDDATLQANWGPQVVGSGKQPNGHGNYVLVNRARERLDGKKYTTDREWFAPVFITREAQNAIAKFALPTGTEVDTKELLAKVPSLNQKVPERIIFGVEGDPKAILAELGGGGGSAPPPWTTELARFAEPPENRGPFSVLTKNFARGRKNLDAINKQDPIRIGDVASIEIGFSGAPSANLVNLLRFTPGRGDHARVILIVGANTAELREQLKAAGEAELLKNKQIALVTCFETETDALREMLLGAGATMVWTPEDRISPDAARKLRSYMEKADAVSGRAPARALDDYLDRALEIWHKESPNDGDLYDLLNGSRWVELHILPFRYPGPAIKIPEAGPAVVVNGL